VTAEASTDGRRSPALRIAAAGDVHCRESRRAEIEDAVAGIEGKADIVLLAGDLTAHGDPAEAAVLAQSLRLLRVPTFAVLGNHDWHGGRHDELIAALVDEEVRVLEQSSATLDVAGTEVGIVGTKGFVGGFAGSHLPDFGEPLLREVYAETSAEVEALDAGLHDAAVCQVRIVLLHYAPTEETLEGELPGIRAFLGTDRLAAPIVEHRPDLVLHGHAHAGKLEGSIAGVPVFNVSVPVMGQAFWLFEIGGVEKALTSIH
jgi:Icc-related predicted phosphoesterase